MVNWLILCVGQTPITEFNLSYIEFNSSYVYTPLNAILILMKCADFVDVFSTVLCTVYRIHFSCCGIFHSVLLSNTNMIFLSFLALPNSVACQFRTRRALSLFNYIFCWEPKGHYHYSTMFCWEPERHYHYSTMFYLKFYVIQGGPEKTQTPTITNFKEIRH